MTELYNRRRPQKLDDLVGQPEVVKALKGLFRDDSFPHALMFHGPSGTGKTSAALVCARQLGCKKHSPNVIDINCATCEPMEMVRQIESDRHQPPANGEPRVWILDEVQSLSRATFAMQGLLGPLEKRPDRRPDHNYYFLCTTNPAKIDRAVRGRCTPIKFERIGDKHLTDLVMKTWSVETGKKHDTDWEGPADRIARLADGSARDALVLLEKLIGQDPKDYERILEQPEEETEAFELVKALNLYKRDHPPWGPVAKVLESIKAADPERLRHMVVNSAKAALLKTGNEHARLVIDSLREPYFQKEVGHALLAADLRRVCGK